MSLRINKFLAQNYGLSRRGVDQLISEGKVLRNGKIARLGDLVDLKDEVKILQSRFQKRTQDKTFKTTTILIYKPIKSVTTRSDELHRDTIYTFLPKEFYSLKPAGRLDYLSEGLLVLSSDGDLIYQLTHPKFQVEKKYLVGLRTALSKELIKQSKTGLLIGNWKLQPVLIQRLQPIDEVWKRFNFLKLEPNLIWYEFTLKEGKNQEIRRICDLENITVNRLIRVQHGKFRISKELALKGHLLVKSK